MVKLSSCAISVFLVQSAQWVFSYPTAILTLSPYTLFPQTRQWRPSHSGITVSSGMEEMPSPNMPIQRLNLAVLPLDISSSGFINRSEEMLTAAKSHKKKPKGSKVYNGVNRYLGLAFGLFRKDYLDCLFLGSTDPSGPGPPHYRGFTITLRHTTFGRTSLDEWSAHHRDLYLTTHNTHNRQTSVLPVGFEPAVQQASGRRPSPYYLNCRWYMFHKQGFRTSVNLWFCKRVSGYFQP